MSKKSDSCKEWRSKITAVTSLRKSSIQRGIQGLKQLALHYTQIVAQLRRSLTESGCAPLSRPTYVHASSGGMVCNPSMNSATLGLRYTMPGQLVERKRERSGSRVGGIKRHG